MARRDPAPAAGITFLRRLRRRAALVLWAERILRAAGPAMLLVLGYFALVAFRLAGGWVSAGAAFLACAALLWEFRGIAAPSAWEIDRRIEVASGLRHRPLAALADHPATGGEIATTLWHMHQARVANAVAQAQTGWPAPFAARQDPFCVRGLLFLLMVCGAVISGPSCLDSVFKLPAWPFTGPEIDAWVTPPSYAGQAPLLLGPGPAMVLQGSTLTVIESGETQTIHFSGGRLAVTSLGTEGNRADGVIRASGRLSVGPWWHRLASWRITAAPPIAPAVQLTAASIAGHAIRLAWQAQDRYGLTSLMAFMIPPGYPDALPQNARLSAATGQGQAEIDAADTPFAGAQVALKLQASNVAGLTAYSESRVLRLPAPDLNDPTAIALATQRRELALEPARAAQVGAQLLCIAAAPMSAISYAADLKIAMLGTALRLRSTDAANAVARLLPLIQQIDRGPDYLPAQQLAAASAALLAALQHGPVDRNNLNRLLQAMQQALSEHLAAIRPAPPGQGPQNFDTAALNRLAQQISADERAGRTAKAQNELQELANALQTLQNARPMSAAQQAQAQAADKAAADLSNLIQNQASLLNQTEQGNGQPAQQARLQSDLQALKHRLEQAEIANLPGLAQAGQSMQIAKKALDNGDLVSAQPAETGAITELQKAAAALQHAAQQTLNLGEPGQSQPGDDPSGNSEDFSLPGLTLPTDNPANTIEQEIIREDADPKLPEPTREYLQRLLTPDP